MYYTALTDMDLRKASEPAAGVFMGEGEKVIKRALDAGLEMVSALMEAKWLPGLEPVLPAHIPVYLAPADLLRDITGYRVHRGALAVFRRPAPRSAAEVLAGASTAVLLEDLVDHANVGSIFRSAAGLGVGAVVVTARCADPWYRRSVKTSMGAVFAVPWATVPDAVTAVRLARACGMSTIALDPAAASSLRTWRRHEPTLLLVGTEGPGLSVAARGAVDELLAIPMRHGVDSLNVAMAATLACYALTS
jgi:tRNA G18 (ribose-2'-O)-methylase SpoU